MAELVPDILEQIPIRVDVRDLIRCKSVCKSWQSLISDPRFIKAHLNHSYNNDRNNNELGHRIVMSRFRCRDTFRQYEVDDRFFDYHDSHLLGSSNGLVCISSFDAEILVANPSTREVKKLRKPQIPDIRSLCWGFGYDSSMDDYKVMVGFRKGEDLTCFQVLTLKSNVWKVIGEVNYSFISRNGILCNGALHWIMNDVSSQNKKKIIFSFHLSKEEFKEIPQPNDARYEFVNAHHLTMCLGIMEECLCIFLRELLPFNLWVTKNYNVKQSWERVPYDYEKCVVVHCLKELKYYIPYKRSFCHDKWLYRSMVFGAPIFVQSLVSPHVHGRLKRKRQAKNSKRSGKVQILPGAEEAEREEPGADEAD